MAARDAIEVVVSADTHGSFTGTMMDASTTIYHHNASADATWYVGPPDAREAAVFLAHIIRRYSSLAERTAYIHQDMALHNPVWPRWLRCLRPNATFASLSPSIFDLNKQINYSTFLLSKALGMPGYGIDSSVPAACCVLLVQSRELAHTKALANYKWALDLLLRNENASTTLFGKPAWEFEAMAHTMHPLRPDWLRPCVNFRCEDPVCNRAVKYFKELPPTTHGVPMLKTNGNLHLWQNKACGVNAVARSEAQALASVRETVQLPCNDAMRSLDEAGASTGCVLSSRRPKSSRTVLIEYIGRIRTRNHSRTPLSQRLRNDTWSAKVAVFALKKRMCTGLVRCWSLCCAECARRPWCEAWQWSLSGECLLSAESPVKARKPSFDRVVGCTSCDVQPYAF